MPTGKDIPADGSTMGSGDNECNNLYRCGVMVLCGLYVAGGGDACVVAAKARQDRDYSGRGLACLR